MKFKKLFVTFLAFVLCFSMLVSCEGGDTTTEGTTTATTTEPAPPDDPTLHLLVEDGKSNYQIVVSATAEEHELNAAYNIRRVIKQLTNVEIPIVEDTAPIKRTEIIVGSHSVRAGQYQPVAEEYRQGYSVFSNGKLLVVSGASSLCLNEAVEIFVKDCFGYDINDEELYYVEPVDTLAIPTAYACHKSLYDLFGDVPLFSILYDGSYLQKRMANVWRDAILSVASDEVEVPTPQVTDNRSNVSGLCIELCPDNTVEAGKWRIDVAENKTIKVYAKDHYGFVSAARSFQPFLAEHLKYYPTKAWNGTHLDSLTALEQASTYAFDQRSEYRAMFYNVLWDNFDLDGRDTMVAEIARLYQPDILGLQEVNRNRRGFEIDGKGGVIGKLAALGYAEVVDPRVRNVYSEEEDIPGSDASLTTDTTEHVPLKGYGITGVPVTVDGETFYTFYNSAPLLYNTNTTKCIDAGYHWYRNQWDRRTGSSHPNTPSDCASKAATWGVFEDLATGERYIAVSTHMCTRNDYIRGLQAEELVNILNALIEQYDCPVILGGDYNGRYTSANYKYFVNHGYTDVEKNNLASLYTSKFRAHHTYPAYDREKGISLPQKNDDTGMYNSSDSVDHILIGNVEEGEIDIFVFGTLVDELTMSSADHFPIFMDFTIHSSTEPTEG